VAAFGARARRGDEGPVSAEAPRAGLVPPPELSSAELVEALTIAMAAAPGVYSRNRHFFLHERAETKVAKRRAALLRGILRHLPKACDLQVSAEPARPVVLTYRLVDLSFERRCEISPVELACLRYLARRAGRPVPGASDEGAEADTRAVEGVLARLGPRVPEATS